MAAITDHLIILPILIPLAAAALATAIGDRWRTLKIAISFTATTLLVVVASLMVARASGGADGTAAMATYPLGNWPVPFGIVLVSDQLSALMVLLASVLGLATLTYSIARWHRAGQGFHAMFQILLMGLNGAFLTGDIFNLFVFFEVLLAASYGLVLHGSGAPRVRAALHYLAVNLLASFLFLIGAALLYGVTGTLNMADLATRIPQLSEESRPLMQSGAAILGLAFLVKAGMWPMSFWLPATYSVAAPPVAAMFGIMTKVGIYALLRLSLLLFGAEAAASQGFGSDVLFFGGIATLVFGSIGVLASQSTSRMASFLLLVSSGTLLTSVGFSNQGVTGGALFYLVTSTLAIGALFLLVEVIERSRIAGADVLALTIEAYGDDEIAPQEDVGMNIPASTALLGICFVLCCLLIAGLPPLSGFIAKVTMLGSALNAAAEPSFQAWVMTALVILSGLCVLIAMARSGISIFWATFVDEAAEVRVAEITPILFLLGLCVLMTALAAPVMDYMEGAAGLLHAPGHYVSAVLDAPLVGTQPQVGQP